MKPKSKELRGLRELFSDLEGEMEKLLPLIREMRAFKCGIDAGVLKSLQDLNSTSGTILSVIKQVFCEKCGALPVWVRSTQFAGKFFFCAKCAKEQPDFGTESHDNFFWRKIG